jgi:hypothetical protein
MLDIIIGAMKSRYVTKGGNLTVDNCIPLEKDPTAQQRALLWGAEIIDKFKIDQVGRLQYNSS